MNITKLTYNITQEIVQVEDATSPSSDGCEPLTNEAALNGKVALIDQGLCSFTAKASKAQAAGAIGVIVVNNVETRPIAMGGSDPTITIPVVMISLKSGSVIKTALAQGINGTLELNPALSGLDQQGRMLLYAPAPVEPQSSVGH